MEKDFLGLNWKASCENVKEKTRNKGHSSVTVTGDPYFSNTLSRQSRFSNFTLSSVEDVQNKNVQDTLISPVFIPVSGCYGSDYSSEIPAYWAENNINMTRKNLPYSDGRNAADKMNHLSNSCIALADGYMVGAPVGHLSLGSTSIVERPPISPSVGFMNVEAGVRNEAGSSRESSRLTIFYDNAVYAYDDISPEKAEGIMHMASTREASDTKPVASNIPSNQAHYSPHIGSSLQSPSATYIERTLPQARKASLNRFLEKRKNRYRY